MKKGRLILAAILFILLSFSSFSWAQTEEFTRGLNYLTSAQNQDGSWGGDTSLTESLPATMSVMETSRILGENSVYYDNAVLWLNSQGIDTTGYLSWKIHVLSAGGVDAAILSSFMDQLTFGWGGYQEYGPNNLDTALAILSLDELSLLDAETLSYALAYLIDTQNPDGGWGFYEGDESNVYMTTHVFSTLDKFSRTFSIATSINNAADYLLSRQNPDGGFGSSPSTAYETALAYLALIGQTTDGTVMGGAINYLTTTQLPDGSWDEDPYSTALALRALATVKPNLSLSASDLTFSNSAPAVGDTITITAIIKNTGTAKADNVLVRFYDGNPASGGTMIGETTIASVLPGGSASASIKWTIPAPSAHEVFVAADLLNEIDELSETDNTSSKTLTLSTLPDLSITSADITVFPPAPDPYIMVSITARIRNLGASDATDVTVKFYDGDPEAGGTLITAGTKVVPLVPAGGTVDVMGVMAPGEVHGSSKTIYVVVDPQNAVTEKDETNNQATKTFLIGYGFTDLTVYWTGITFDPNNPREGDDVTISAAVSNSGKAGVGSSKNIIVGFYLGDPAAGGVKIGSDQSIASLEVGESKTVSTAWDTSGHPGSNMIYVVADADNTIAETSELNNKAFKTLEVLSNEGGELTVTSLDISFEPPALQTDDTVTIIATIENRGSADVSGIVGAEIRDQEGAVLAIVSPAEPEMNFSPSSSIQTAMFWNTGQFSPGEYSVVLKVTAPPPVAYPGLPGYLLAELSGSFSIEESKDLLGSISLSPPVVQADIQTPVFVKAVIRNTGNVPISTTLILEANLDGSPVYTKESAIVDLLVNGVTELDLGSFIPSQGGDYSVILRPADQTIAADISTALYVGPHVSADFTVSPDTAIAGDAHVTGKISLKGVGNATGTEEDPLVPVIKDAIQKGVNWEQINSLNWQNSHKCYGCHVQAQTIIGSELSRNKVMVNDVITQQLLDYIKSCQAGNGLASFYPGSTYTDNHPVSNTVYFAWALAYYHDPAQIQEALQNAVNYLLQFQTMAGAWLSDDWFDKNFWWDDFGYGHPSTPFTSYTVIALVKAYQLSSLQKYEDAVIKAVNYLNGTDHARSIITAAHMVIGLRAALPLIDDPVTKATVEDRTRVALDYLRSSQNPDGGWGRYGGDASDPLPTAQALYAMSMAGVAASDPTLREGTTYLIGKQNADGTWVTAFIRRNTYPDMYFSATTWAIISLPVALETIAGWEADLTVTFPSDIILNGSSTAPTGVTPSGNNTAYVWNFEGLNGEGVDLLLDLTLSGLPIGEQRKVATDACLSFKDTYTGKTLDLPIEIPSVKGIAPVSMDVTTDKTEYSANESVSISTVLTNLSPEIRNPVVTLAVEDADGNAMAQLSDIAPDMLGPLYKPAFLNGWRNRVKLTLDHDKIDSDLADFPVRIHLSSASGMNNADISAVFDELGNNSKKISVTTSDGQTQCYVEIENWDAVNEEADLWVKVPSISSTKDTILYLYYDSTQPDNTQYAGDVASAPALSVWDDNFQAVYHMNQDPSGLAPQILDSTVNEGNGTTGGSMTSADLVDSRAGKGLEFDGMNDYISVPDSLVFQAMQNITVEAWILPGRILPAGSYTHSRQTILSFKEGDNPNVGAVLALPEDAPNRVRFWVKVNGVWQSATGTTIISPNAAWYHIAGSYDGAAIKIYVNGILEGQKTVIGAMTNAVGSKVTIGARASNNMNWFQGLIDEVSISHVAQSPDWIKASYHSQSDDLISFGSIESVIDALSTQTVSVPWNTGSTIAGDYIVRAKLYDKGEFLSEDTAQFSILPVKTVDSAVVTDRINYLPHQPVEITSTITSLSPNYIFEDLNARIVIIDSNGHIQVTEDKPVLTLLPGQTVPLKTYWNTSTNPKGVYAATLEVFEDAQLISSCQTTFEVLGSTETGKGLMGMINAQPDPVNQGTDEEITFSVTNNGNENISDLHITVLIVDPDTQEMKQTFDQTTDLPMTATVSGSFVASTSNLDLRTYVAILRAGSSSLAEPVTLSSTSFTVKDGIPPVVTVISPVTGNLYTSQFVISVTAIDDASGIDTVEYRIDEGAWTLLSASDPSAGIYLTQWNPGITDEGEHTIKFRATDKAGNISVPVSTTFSIEVLSGTITAQPDPVFQGKEETIVYSISNSSYEDTGDLELIVLIVDTETGEMQETFTETVNVPSGSTSSGSFTVPTLELTPKTYSAVLQVMTPAQDLKTLGSVTFEVKPGIEVTKTIPDLKNVLVWLNYPWTSGQDCPDRLLIEQALTEGGWSYFIVLDKKDFERELRNPSYTDFLILGAQHPIEDHFSEELREQVYSGKGLISALFDRQNLNEDLFGVKATGTLPRGDFVVELADSVISPQGTFQSYGRALDIQDINPAETIGWLIETTKKGTTRHPGIMMRQYGEGKVIFYAFDLGMSTVDYGSFAAILGNSLNTVHKPADMTAFYPEALVPAEITIKSLGGSFDLRLTETYPQGLKLYYPTDAEWITENPWTIDLTLSPEETRSILYYVLTPDVLGTYSLETEVGYMDNGVYTFYQDLEAEIAVAKDKVTMVNDAIAAIQALSLSGPDKAKAANALKYLENVRTRVITASDDMEASIADLLKAIESTLSITDADVSDIRLAIDDLLKTWEGAWYLE